MSDILHPIETEWALISVILSGRAASPSDVETLQAIVPEHFSGYHTARAYRACKAILARRETPNLVTLDAELSKLYGAKVSAEVMQKAVGCGKGIIPSWVDAPRYIATILDAHKRRQLDALSQELRKHAQDGTADIAAVIDSARATLRETVRDAGEWISGLEAATRAFEAAENKVRPIPTGFRELDRVLCGGLTKPELTLVGARPGKGKSAFLMAVAMNAAREKRHTCYVSLEMSDIQIGQRALAQTSMVSVSKQRVGWTILTDNDWKAMTDGLEILRQDGFDGFFHTYVGHGLTLEKLSGLAQNAYDRGELDLLVVDYIQLLRTTQQTRSDFERIGIVSKGLKELALTLDIPIITAAQVKRQPGQEGKAPRAPGLDELRGSGDLEQDADNVLLIHTPDSEKDATLKNVPLEHENIFQRAKARGLQAFSVEIAKQRQGANMRTWCLFKPMVMKFYEDE